MTENSAKTQGRSTRTRTSRKQSPWGLRSLVRDINAALDGRFRKCQRCGGRGRIQPSSYNPWSAGSEYAIRTEQINARRRIRCPRCDGSGRDPVDRNT